MRPPFIDICIVRKKPFAALAEFTLYEGDVETLRTMLPDSEFVKLIESRAGIHSLSVSAVTQLKIDLEYLQEDSLSRDQYPRSPLHSKYGETSAHALREWLVKRIDQAFITCVGVAPF